MKQKPLRAGTLEKLEALLGSKPSEALVANLNPALASTEIDIQNEFSTALTMQQIGHSLRAIRNHRKLSTRALAQALGISQTRVLDVERANETLELQTITRFASQLGYRVLVQMIPEQANDPILSVQLPRLSSNAEVT